MDYYSKGSNQSLIREDLPKRSKQDQEQNGNTTKEKNQGEATSKGKKRKLIKIKKGDF
jgi:hypothetical protein